MSCDDKLLREYVRSIILNEKLAAARTAGIGDREVRATGGYSFEDLKGVPRVKVTGPLTGILWLMGQSQATADAIGAIFGKEGLFNISALWDSNASFLGEETLKPAWDYLMETLSMESTPRNIKGEDFWARLFGRTSSVANDAADSSTSRTPVPPVIPDPITEPEVTPDPEDEEGKSLADRLADVERERVSESLMFIFEQAVGLESNILTAFSNDVDDISSVISAIESSQNLVDSIAMVGDLLGYQVDDNKILDAMTKADGTFSHDELFSIFKDKILKEIVERIVLYVESFISDGSTDSLLANISPSVKSEMIDIIRSLLLND